MSERVKANYVDHVSIAVRSVERAAENFRKAFGWELDGNYVDEDEKIRVSYFLFGSTAVELMEDLDGTGEVAKYIEKHGEGVMVLSFNVDDCGKALEMLQGNGAHLIDQKPRFTKPAKRYFGFLHPQTYGVLTEIIDGKY